MDDLQPGEALLSPKSRKRTNGRACMTCHERKVRCDILDTGPPCSNCRLQRRSRCHIYEKKKTRASLASPRRPPRNVQIRPQPTRSREGSESLDAPRPTSPASTPGEISIVAPSSHYSSGTKARRSHRNPGQSPSITVGEARETDGSTSMLADFIDRDDVRAGEISRMGHLYYIGTEFSNLHYLVRQRSRRVNEGVFHFGSNMFASRTPRIPSEALQVPPKRIAEQLVEAYFTKINRGFPIVDEEEFMSFYHNPGPNKKLSPLLLNAVFVVGSHVLSATREDIRAMRPTFFRRTKTLFDSRSEQHREVYLQAALLLTWYCDNLEEVVSNSWYWIGVASRTAFGMGMHRDVTPSGLNRLDKRQWVRWWWTMFQFDVMVSTSHGRPQAMNLEESDVPPLEQRHFEGIPHAEVDFAIQHTNLCIVFSEAMRKRVSIRSSAADRARATEQADERLADFITNLPEQLHLSLTELDAWQATLHLSYNNFLILLHRPLPWKKKTESNPDPIGDLNICSDAVVAIVSIFEGLRRRGYLGNLWLPSIYTLFTAMVYITRELDSVNPVVAAKSSRMFDSLLLTLRELSQHWLYAQSLIRLFENRDWWKKKKQGQGAGDSMYNSLEENSEQSVNLNVQAAPPELHRELMADGPGQGSTRPSERNTAPGQTTLDAHRPEELLNGWAYDPLRSDNVDVATGIGDAWDMMTLPSDLELFLAGIGNEYNY